MENGARRLQPATVVSWQRRRFKQYWRRLSQKKGPGRPKVSAEVRKLVRTMAAANVTWGAPRAITDVAEHAFYPSLLQTRDGRFHLAWFAGELGDGGKLLGRIRYASSNVSRHSGAT